MSINYDHRPDRTPGAPRGADRVFVHRLLSTAGATNFLMRLTLLLSVLFSLATSVNAQSHEGSINGTVSADGGPVAGAHVYAEVMQGSKILTILNTRADDLGVFAFLQLALGEYRVYADKSEIGYLSTRPDIFTSDPPLVIVLTPDSPTTTTSIRFGPKAAVITGWVKDSVTGKPIAAHLSLAPVDGHAWSTAGTNGRFEFRLLIPSDTAVNLGVCAEGYKTWSYPDEANPSRPMPLRLGPGDELELDIYLQHNLETPQSTCPSGTY